ncbi:MAG: SDR family oxidoreductase [Burkholderiaceae bacterium]
MSSPPKKAVVVGALGVIGRYIVDRLLAAGDWQVVGLSRRPGPERDGYAHVSVDLLDAAQCRERLSGLTDITHVFFAGFQPATGKASGFASNVGPNRDLLANSVSAIEAASPGLQRVVLITGTKYYGTHLGPLKTPFRESDPRHMPPDYYFDQIDWLTERQRGKRWDWVELRPQTLCGFAPGTAMSIVPAIAVYAAVSKALGLPLRFPGAAGGWTNLYQVTESDLFAKAAHWAAETPACSNQAYNITNGDVFRWCNLWPRIAEVFEMPVGVPQQISLTEQMADKQALWSRLQQTHGLQSYAYQELVAWPFADYVFGTTWDVISNLTKIRQAGFHEVVDTEQMFVDQLTRFRREKIVP